MDVDVLVPNLDLFLVWLLFHTTTFGFLFLLLDKTIVFFLLDFYVRKGGSVAYSPPFLKQGDTFETLYM